MDRKLLVGFSSLFWGQTQCYFDLSKMSTIWKPLTLDTFHAHLTGALELGVYCTNDEALSYWGCVDFDAPEKTKQADSRAYQAALQLRSKYGEYGITSWIERSRSKGYHVWIFPERPMPSRVLRSAQLSILSDLGMSGIETNPKQENLWHTSIPKTAPRNRQFGIGNLVRIPYSPLAGVGRMVVLSGRGEPLDLPRFVLAALEGRPAPIDLERLAAQQGGIQRPWVAIESQGPTGDAGKQQEAYEIWKGDRKVGKGERDNQFYTLVRLMKANGLIYSDACDQLMNIYQQKVIDKQGFSLDDVLSKAKREYGR